MPGDAEVQKLHRDLTAKFLIERAIYHAHAAGAKLLLNPVMSQPLADQWPLLGERMLSHLRCRNSSDTESIRPVTQRFPAPAPYPFRRRRTVLLLHAWRCDAASRAAR